MKSNRNSSESPELDGYEILVGVCGGIAAYKVCEVVSRLVQRGVGVTVAMTKAARKFVGPTTFQALTGRRVLTNLWHADQAADIRHIAITDTADLMLVAPATANIIGKIANGIADDLVSTLVIGAASSVVLAPAMNERMWNNPVVQRNVSALAERGYRMVGPGEGWLACRSVGPGRMAEPDEIVDAIVPMLQGNPAKRIAKAE
jgi:phosphopantothenoylcysteine decarboxylase/phosphopantothenate--cysteine ligase